MISLPLSITLLSVVTLLVFLGFAERILDRMRLTDTVAIVLLGLLIVGHFLPAVHLSDSIAVNLGLFVPIGIVVYLVATSAPHEQRRAGFTSLITAGLLWATDRFFPLEPGFMRYDVDPIYLGGVIAGLTAYVLGRSRRSAFIGAIVGILLLDILAVVDTSLQGLPQTLVFGGGGALDATIVSALLAVAIAEGIGEIRERIHRGPAQLQDGEGNNHE